MRFVALNRNRRGDGRKYSALVLHERYHIVNEEGSLVDGSRRAYEGSDTGGNMVKRADVEGIVTDLLASVADLQGYVDEKGAVRAGAENGEDYMPYSFFHK